MNKKSNSNHQCNKERFQSFLESLKGRMVTIYRNDPEAKTGRLLDVQSDYIVLELEHNTIVYYQIHHVKSVSEDSKANQPVKELDEELDFIKEESFSDLFRRLKNEYIQINQGGPYLVVGTLLETSNDYIILALENNEIVYFNLDHVKSALKLSKGIKSNHLTETKDSDQTMVSVSSKPSTSISHEILKAEYFADLFDQLMHKWVLINRRGPDALEGILVENAGGYFTITNNHEIIRINPFHIKCISIGPKTDKKEENDQIEAEEDHPLRSLHKEKKPSLERRSGRRSGRRSEKRSHSRSA